MKVKITILPKKATVNPADKVVMEALHHLGYTQVAGVHMGRYLLIEGIDTSANDWENCLAKALLMTGHLSEVMETWKFEIVE
ncbi:MAG: phosphoribosylformylglycinamidine synthase subunit PurS [Patescibacteria group bacterium]